MGWREIALVSGLKQFDNLVWFKKDLRVEDHEALLKAVRSGKTLALFVVEETWLKSYECSDKHKQFLRESLVDLKSDLDELNVPFIVKTGDALDLISSLHRQNGIKNLYSHQETGVWWTYKRDLLIKDYCQVSGLKWTEFQNFGVIRGLKNRDLWAPSRKSLFSRDVFPKPSRQSHLMDASFDFDLSGLKTSTDNPHLQKGKRAHAIKILNDFFIERGEFYYKEMSSPLSARTSCSRISPYLSWGLLSVCEVQKTIDFYQKRLLHKDPSSVFHYKRSYDSFQSRLWWHCHFIQKLETEPEIEFRNMNRGFDGLRENDFDDEKFEAWKKGETGFPLVDACMRCLLQTGWINFRMRALLVSFASYQLWLHWPKTAEFLAKHFVDFEPGIHFSQFQMQSGVTGINNVRIYSPVKQSWDQDPKGEFIKEYCPELKGLDPQHIHEPQKTPPLLAKMMGFELGESYPQPIVNAQESYNRAKTLIFERRATLLAQQEAGRVYQKHGSRKRKQGKL